MLATFNYPKLEDPGKAELAEAFFYKFIRGNNLTRTSGKQSVWRLVGQKDPGLDEIRNVNCDHGELFLKDGKPYAYVFHPYQFHAEDIVHLGRFCDKYNLGCTISTQSWWNPGGTFVVILTKHE